MPNALATRPGLGMRRAARSSDDYVKAIQRIRDPQTGESKITLEQKQAAMYRTLSDPVNGIQRLGVGMIGPIQLKLRYQGITRNVLMEDTITPGTPVEYEVMDDLGQAYVLSGHDGEVRITPFEGKRVRVDFFRIASRPMIRKEDLYSLRVNAVDYAQDETKQSIMKQEDSRLMVVLQAALTGYASRPDHIVTPNHVVTEASGYFTPASIYTAASMVEAHELSSTRMLVNVIDHRDFYRWDINTTGWAFKDRTVAGEQITSFGEFQFQRSIMVPQGTMYLLPDPNFLGVFPVLYSLDVEESHEVPDFWKGWTFDEFVNMTVLNPRGIAAVTKV